MNLLSAVKTHVFCVPKTRQQICQNNGRAIGQILMSECLAVDHLMVIRGWVRYCGILAVLSAGHKKHVFPKIGQHFTQFVGAPGGSQQCQVGILGRRVRGKSGKM